MPKFEQEPRKESRIYSYSEEAEEVALRASEMKEFQEVVRRAENKLEAIKAVRKILPAHFPEIKDIPEPMKNEQDRRMDILGAASNEFMIAKNIVDLLFKEK